MPRGAERLLREPLLHFAAIGALLFAVSAALDAWRRPAVVLSAAEVAQLAAYWQAQSGRSPTPEELRGIVAERVDEEIMAEEARRLGLDRDDVIVRRRLAQKYAFVREDLSAAREPTEAELRAYFEAHRDAFASRGGMALRQVYFSAERTDAAAAVQAAARRLARAPDAPVDGDVFILPLSYAAVAEADLARDYGEPFAKAVATAPVGAWTGPLRSAYGWHMVRVEAREPSRAPAFEAVREGVRTAWREDELAHQRAEERQALRARYRVVLPKELAQ
jgi:hypothetical protein